ncbi:MAG: cell envelope integrity protein TolA [Pseudomonadota bacterium]
MIHQIPFSKALQYSLLVHGVFIVILVMSWQHKPEPEPVQVALWSGQEVAQARHAEESMAVTKRNAPSIPKTPKPIKHIIDEEQPVKALPKPLIRTPKVVHTPTENNVPDEEADIQIERKRIRKHRVEKLEKLKEVKEPKPFIHHTEKQEPKKTFLKKIKEVFEPVEPEKPKYRKVPHKQLPKTMPKMPIKEAQVKPDVSPKHLPLPSQKATKKSSQKVADTESDDKADWIENQMNASAPARSTSAAGSHGASSSGSAAGNGKKRGVDCSQLGGYCSKIRSKVQGNLEWSDDQDVTSAALFEVTLFPNGDIRRISLKKSSGNADFDKAVEHAIRASSPFPKPDNPNALADNMLNFSYALHK